MRRMYGSIFDIYNQVDNLDKMKQVSMQFIIQCLVNEMTFFVSVKSPS